MVWFCRAVAVSEHPYWIRCTPLLHSQQYRCKVPIAKSGGSRCFSLDYLHVLSPSLSAFYSSHFLYFFFFLPTVQASTRLACCCMITPFLHGRQRRVWWSLLYTMHTKEELEFCPRLPKFPPLLKILKVLALVLPSRYPWTQRHVLSTGRPSMYMVYATHFTCLGCLCGSRQTCRVSTATHRPAHLCHLSRSLCLNRVQIIFAVHS